MIRRILLCILTLMILVANVATVSADPFYLFTVSNSTVATEYEVEVDGQLKAAIVGNGWVAVDLDYSLVTSGDHQIRARGSSDGLFYGPWTNIDPFTVPANRPVLTSGGIVRSLP